MTRRRSIFAWMVLIGVWIGPLPALHAANESVRAARLRQLAAQEQATLEQSGAILHDAALDRYLNGVVARLWKAAGADLKMPVVQVIMSVRMEAYTYPNGYIFVSTGILDPIENEDQLAMIIAHEMVHYIRHHAAALYDQFQNPFHDGGWSCTGRRRVVDAKYLTQKINAAELQADRQGLAILGRAGYCQTEALAFISNLINGLKNRATPEALKSLADRRAILQGLIDHKPTGPACSSNVDGRSRKFLNGIAPAWRANAQIALRWGDWDQAERSVTKYLALRPHDARAYYLQGEILRRRQDGDQKSQSARCYKEALKIDPHFPPAYRALGELYFKAGRYRQAKTYFEAFLSLAPQDEASAYIRGYLRQCR
jgi:beta-barrel assembly-enhancing protease